VQPGPAAEFSASFDSAAKVTSTAACAVLLLVAVLVHNIFASVSAILVVALAYAWSPRAYRVSPGVLTISRLIGAVHVPLASIRAARKAVAGDLTGAIRLWGNGGLFGYYGFFRTSSLGVSRWYVTNRANAVVLITDSRPLVVSPDDVDAFLAAVGAPAHAEPSASPTAPSRPFPAGNWVGLLLGGGLALAALSVMALAALYSPGPPRYTLTPSALTIHDRFYPVTVNMNAVDVGHIRVVDVAADSDWRLTARTNGFANAHYRAGWFRVAGGTNVRLYRADGTRLVLLPPKGNGAPVLLQVTDPDKFVQQLQREW